MMGDPAVEFPERSAAPRLLPTQSQVAPAPAAGSLAIYVERDRRYVAVIRRIRGSCPREEWDHPAHRRAAIDRAWEAAERALRLEGYELLTPAPVVVPIRDQMTGGVIGHWRTTYRHWAEGPLPHLDTSPVPLPPLSDEVQQARAENSAVRERLDALLVGAQVAPPPRQVFDDGWVDFRIKGVFRRADYRVLRSLQSGEDAKLLLEGGGVEDGYDEEG